MPDRERSPGWVGPLLAGLAVLLLGIVSVFFVVRSIAGTSSIGGGQAPVAAGTATAGGTTTSATPGPSATPRPESVTVAAAGDLACDPSGKADEDGDNEGPDKCQMNAVGALVAAAHPTAFLPLGDTQYDDGALDAYRKSYAKAFGALLPITRPAVGNHEYLTHDADGYFAYFGSRAGTPGKGWYSYDLGGWHVVVLNANCDQVDCKTGGDQQTWLRADLAAHPTRCTLAYWHQPRWSSGEHGDNESVGDLVSTFVDGGGDVVLNGHDHDYERFRRQDADGRADPQRGIREFVVGTGGRSLREAHGEEGTEAVDYADFGALFLTLTPTSYTWQFRSVHRAVVDSGTTTCH